ncbi:hypothetical protein HOY80DRAFT_1023360 [Tuber brumale]|nr:hypothetical protein HOY80DRAFT_1023360 [Tuber brumale]
MWNVVNQPKMISFEGLTNYEHVQQVLHIQLARSCAQRHPWIAPTPIYMPGQIIVHVDTTTFSLMKVRMKHTNLAWIPLRIELQDLEAGFDKGCLGVGSGLSLWVTGSIQNSGMNSFKKQVLHRLRCLSQLWYFPCRGYMVKIWKDFGRTRSGCVEPVDRRDGGSGGGLGGGGSCDGGRCRGRFGEWCCCGYYGGDGKCAGSGEGILESCQASGRQYGEENGYNPLEMIHFPDMLRSELEEIKTKIFLIFLEKLYYSIQRLKNPGNNYLPLWSLVGPLTQPRKSIPITLGQH